MKPLPAFLQLDPYQISPADVTQMVFRCQPEAIHPDVIFMPIWQPQVFELWAGPITTITPHILFEMEFRGKPVSVVRSGVGAPLAGDAVLALGYTACERIFFAGSVGGLRPEISIGDLMLPEFSYAGDGYCRYLQPGFPPGDCFLERLAPDPTLAAAVAQTEAALAKEAGVDLHRGPVYSIDSILAQFSRLDAIANDLGCIGIEMETAAVFKAARLVGIRAAALFSVSDVPARKQTLYAGRSPEERARRSETRRRVLALALLECLHAPDIEQPAGGLGS